MVIKCIISCSLMTWLEGFGQESPRLLLCSTSSIPGRERSTSRPYFHPAYLTYMQCISCEMPGWMKHKLESSLQGEISIPPDMQMTPPLWQKVKRNQRAYWWKWKRKAKSWLKTQHSKNEDNGIWSHHLMANRWGNNGNSVRLCFLGPPKNCRWWLKPWN